MKINKKKKGEKRETSQQTISSAITKPKTKQNEKKIN